VSQTSGRGVGLDVVKHNVSKLSGIIDIFSEPGKGTRFTITLPITLAIIQALLVRCGGMPFALPLASVLEVVVVTPPHLCRVDGQEMIELRGQTVPLIRFSEVFALPEPAETDVYLDREGMGYAALIGLAQHRVALFVDDVTGQQDIVIKPLGEYLARVRGFAGATQRGDQETILVLDVAALVEAHFERGRNVVRDIRGVNARAEA
jgi:two-component system chemotaxis sensor kinase CheA